MERRSFIKTVGAALGSSMWSRYGAKIVDFHDPDGWPLKYIFYDRDIIGNQISKFQRRGYDVAYSRDVRDSRDDNSKILLAIVEQDCNARRHRGEWGQSEHEILLSAAGKFVKAEAPVERIGLTEVGIKVVYK